MLLTVTTPPQPVPNNHSKILIWVIVGVAIFALCLVAIVCLGPLGLFAWIVDRPMDVVEDQAPHFQLIQ